MKTELSNPYSITVPDNCTLPDPIYIDGTHPKTIIHAKENSEASVIEIIQHREETPYPSHRSLQIILHRGAKLNHTFIQKGSPGQTHALAAHIHQHADSHYSGSVFMMGGRMIETDIQIHLAEPKAISEFRALQWGHLDQHLKLTLGIHHHARESKSHVVARGVMTDRARGAFTGKIHVYKNASGTNAMLQSKNLLLSSEAEVKTQPQLEIDHDDVQCSHGATTGYLDLEALFYLKSRGIPEIEAKRMLIDSFIHPAFQLLPKDTLFVYLEKLIHEHS